MALISPFRADRFQDPKTGDAAPCAAPPYDVLGAAARARFAATSSASVVHLTLPEERGGKDRYSVAAATLRDMLRDGRLAPDDEPTFHLQDAQFVGPDGKKRMRRGFLALVRIQPLGGGAVRGHEQVLPKPLEDRTRLMEATRANLEPVFLLYSDPIGRVDALLEGSRLRPTAASVAMEGVRFDFRRADPKIASRVVDVLRELPLYVADGHHRYTVSDRYRAAHPDDAGARWRLALLVRAQDPGVVILPTHRFLPKVAPEAAAALVARLGASFEQRAVRPEQLLNALAATEAKDAIGVWLRRENRALIATPNPVLRARLAETSELLARLDVSVLERGLLDPAVLGATVERRYVRGEDDPIGLAGTEDVDAAFFLRAPAVETVLQVSDKNLNMPPKSTYFFPKAASGQVLYRFDRGPESRGA